MHSLPFNGGLIYALLFWSACVLWILPEIIASRFKRSPDASKVRDRGSLNLIVALWWVGMAVDFSSALFLPKAAIVWNPTLVFFAGIGLMLAGTAFRWYSVSILGKYFTFDVAIQSGQNLVETGPYRYIRHPSYSGALLALVGFGLALGNWAGLGVFLGCMAGAYAYRIPVEEASLAGALGQPYRQYVTRTWRLVPFLF